MESDGDRSLSSVEEQVKMALKGNASEAREDISVRLSFRETDLLLLLAFATSYHGFRNPEGYHCSHYTQQI